MVRVIKRRIIIAGGRDFDNYELLKESCNTILAKSINNPNEKIIIVSGTAKGADKLGERYAKEYGYEIAYYPANWDKHGKRAGYLRNAQMADNADALIAFWDSNSRGTKHMIDLAQKKQLHIRLIRY